MLLKSGVLPTPLTAARRMIAPISEAMVGPETLGVAELKSQAMGSRRLDRSKFALPVLLQERPDLLLITLDTVMPTALTPGDVIPEDLPPENLTSGRLAAAAEVAERDVTSVPVAVAVGLGVETLVTPTALESGRIYRPTFTTVKTRCRRT